CPWYRPGRNSETYSTRCDLSLTIIMKPGLRRIARSWRLRGIPCGEIPCGEIPLPAGNRDLSYATMSGDNYATLSKAQLFARLGRGLAGGVTVVTPNRRLAQALAREFDAAQAAQGRSAWESADILPYSAFVERCYDDALYSGLAAALPILLTPAQERSLWEDIIRRSDAGGALLAIPETAALAADAWQTAHAWRLLDSLRSTQLNEDASAFRDWCAQYSLRCEHDGYADAALLPDLVAARLNGD